MALFADGDSLFHAQPSQLGGVNSIIGFKVLAAGDQEHALDTAALRRIHQWLTADVSVSLPPSASETERKLAKFKCFIGQPVDLGDVAILRLAIGAALACELAGDMGRLEKVLGDDAKVLDKLEMLVKYRDALATA